MALNRWWAFPVALGMLLAALWLPIDLPSPNRVLHAGRAVDSAISVSLQAGSTLVCLEGTVGWYEWTCQNPCSVQWLQPSASLLTTTLAELAAALVCKPTAWYPLAVRAQDPLTCLYMTAASNTTCVAKAATTSRIWPLIGSVFAALAGVCGLMTGPLPTAISTIVDASILLLLGPLLLPVWAVAWLTSWMVAVLGSMSFALCGVLSSMAAHRLMTEWLTMQFLGSRTIPLLHGAIAWASMGVLALMYGLWQGILVRRRSPAFLQEQRGRAMLAGVVSAMAAATTSSEGLFALLLAFTGALYVQGTSRLPLLARAILAAVLPGTVFTRVFATKTFAYNLSPDNFVAQGELCTQAAMADLQHSLQNPTALSRFLHRSDPPAFLRSRHFSLFCQAKTDHVPVDQARAWIQYVQQQVRREPEQEECWVVLSKKSALVVHLPTGHI